MSRVNASFVSAFEQICQDAQVPATRAAAERSLDHFRHSDDALSTAIGVIESSSSSIARFHAAAVLREAALSRWNLLSPDQRYGPASLRVWAVTVVANNATMMPYERKALLGAAAAFFRRAYVEETVQSQKTFLQLLTDVVTNRDSPTNSAVAALQLLDMLAEEFLTPKSLKGVEIEIMSRARPKFLRGDGHVVTIFRAALHSLQTTLAITSELDPATLESRCIPALDVVARILTLSLTKTNFQEPEPVGDASRQAVDTEPSAVLRLDSSWAPLTVQVLEAVQIAFRLIDVSRRYSQLSEEARLPNSATQVVLAVCSISRSSFSSPDFSSSVLRCILSSIENQQWISSTDISERMAYAEVWRQISSSHGLQGLAMFGKEVFESFANNTYKELRRNANMLLTASQDDILGIMDGTDLLLETWATFVYDARNGRHDARQVLEPLVGKIFVEYVHMSVKSTRIEKLPSQTVISGLVEDLEEEDLGFDDTSAEESRMTAAATLARFSLPDATAVLVNCLDNRCEKAFFQYSPSKIGDVTLSHFVQEDVYFLIDLMAAVLADSCIGEVPSVPEGIRELMLSDGLETSKRCGHALFSSLLRASEAETRMLEGKGVHSDEASPRIGRAFLEALERIARTYLVPTENREDTFAVIGGEGFAAQAREYSLSKAMEAIKLRFFEPEISHAASTLLQTLSCGAKNYSDLRGSGVWQQLLTYKIDFYQRIPPSSVEGIAIAITTVLGEAVADHLVNPASKSLPLLMAPVNVIPDAAERCIACINLLKGVARSQNVGPMSLRALADSMAFDGSVARCAIFFQPERYDVIRSAILLADDMLYGRLALLSDQEAQKLLANSMYLVNEHTTSIVQNGGRMAQDEAVLGIEQILQLLQHILDERPSDAMSEYLFRGLSSLLPCMNESFLDYPMVRKSYFEFITNLVSIYPLSVLSLPLDLRHKIVQSLKIELVSQDSNAERRSLEAIGALAKELAVNEIRHDHISHLEAELVGMFESILSSLAHGSAFTDNLGAASETILPLIFFKGPGYQQHFEAVGNKLIAEGGNQPAMAEILNKLRERAAAASVWYGFRNQPIPHDRTRPPVLMRRLASKDFKEAVFEFSVRSRDVLLNAATQTAG